MHVCVHSRYDILVIKQILSCKGQDLIGVDNLLWLVSVIKWVQYRWWLYCYCQICMSSKLKHVHCDIQCQHVRLVPPSTYIGDTSLTSISRTEGLVGTSCLDRKCSGYTPSILQSSWDAQFLVETSKNIPPHGTMALPSWEQLTRQEGSAWRMVIPAWAQHS